MTSTINPGEELASFLKQLYPSPPSKINVFLQKMDYDLMADGELVDLLYRSCINYAVRRLITTAEHFRRDYPPDQYGSSRYQIELRKHLRDYTRYRDRVIDKLVKLLVKCLRAMDQAPTAHQKRKIRRQAAQNSLSCYICGRELDYDKHSREHNSATVDHIWPRSIGGLSNDDNLRIACHDCNANLKKDYIDDSDYHYEEIALVSASYAEYREQEKSKQYEVAVFAKSQSECSVCGQPAHRVGDLYIDRKEPSDSWHFLNLAAYCFEHKPKG